MDGRDRLWVVYLVMAVEAALAQLNDPARNALIANLARLVGSLLGGVLVEVAGLPGLVVGDAASFLLGAALLALVRPSPKPSAPAVALGRARRPAPALEPALAVPGPPEGERRRTRCRERRVVHSPRPGRGVLEEWVDGLRVVLGDRGLRWGLVVGLAGGWSRGGCSGPACWCSA